MKIYLEKNNENIKKRVADGMLNISVFGIGKMGLPLACIFAEHGFEVIGVGRKKEIIEQINKGRNPIIGEAGMNALLKRMVKRGKLKATDNGREALQKADIVILIVPTLLKEDGIPDLSAIESVAKTIGSVMEKGTLVILESTVPPGTSEGLLKSILEAESGLKAGVDFGIAFCPERTNSGTAIADIKGRINPKVVGGMDEQSTYIASLLYGKINKRGIIPVSGLKVAEMVKISEMVYRDVKISYANSLALICDQLKINTDEVIKAANTDADCKIMKPGGGVGGHCIPVYPYFIFDKVKKNIDLLKSARKINDQMPKYVIQLTENVLKEQSKKIENCSILILGISYRGNVKETRLSPATEVYRRLNKIAKSVSVYDPLYENEEIEKMDMKVSSGFQKIDCIIVMALHDKFKSLDFKKIGQNMATKAFVDTTNFFDPKNLKKLGFSVRSVGHHLE